MKWCKHDSYALLLLITYAATGNSMAPNVPLLEAPTEATVVAKSVATGRIAWLQHLQKLRRDIRSCQQHDTTWKCFSASSLRIFDSIMSERVVPIWEGVRLVRDEEEPTGIRAKAGGAVSASRATKDAILASLERKDLQHLTWFDRIAMTLAKTLTTHMLQINLNQLTEAYLKRMDGREKRVKQQLSDPVGTARFRRHRYNMIITMMFGVTALGAILVPMGFQLLSVVSGKALLLAKMALLLASINGLKRVANSGIHYGLYHVPGETLGAYYDRGDVHHPRNVPSIAVAQPVMDYGIRK